MQSLSILHTEKENLERGKGGGHNGYLIREGWGVEPIFDEGRKVWSSLKVVGNEK
jgi:hypothetical protein